MVARRPQCHMVGSWAGVVRSDAQSGLKAKQGAGIQISVQEKGQRTKRGNQVQGQVWDETWPEEQGAGEGAGNGRFGRVGCPRSRAQRSLCSGWGLPPVDTEPLCLRRGVPPGSAQHPAGSPASARLHLQSSDLALPFMCLPCWAAAVTASQFKVNSHWLCRCETPLGRKVQSQHQNHSEPCRPKPPTGMLGFTLKTEILSPLQYFSHTRVCTQKYIS